MSATQANIHIFSWAEGMDELASLGCDQQCLQHSGLAPGALGCPAGYKKNDDAKGK